METDDWRLECTYSENAFCGKVEILSRRTFSSIIPSGFESINANGPGKRSAMLRSTIRSVAPFFHCCLLLSLFLQVSVLSWVGRSQHPCMKRTFIHSLCLRQSRFFSSSPAMSFSESHKDYSLIGLQEYAKTLIQSNLDQDEASRTSVCISIAGGGGHAISTLAATPGASSMLLEGSVNYSRQSYRSYIGLASHIKGFKYSSHEAAKLASEAALKRALKYRTDNLNLMTGCVGIGCASSLVSSASGEGVQGFGHIVATRSDGCQVSLNVTLAGMKGMENRTRQDEDVFISHLILRSIELVQQADRLIKKSDKTETDVGDYIKEDWGTILVDQFEEEDVASAAAHRILDGNEQAVVLLPTYREGRAVSFQAMKFPAIPKGSLVVPGSFNPPHKGHIALAETAVAMAESMEESRYSCKAAFMELSLTNADKPPIDPETVSARVSRFLELDHLPDHWGIILTRAPLFSQKVSTLQDCVLDSTDGSKPKLSFVIGTDTFVRIIDPKYYNNEESAMIEAFRSMEGVRFLVGGRLEQKKELSTARFVSGKEELEGLPEDVRAMFTLIEEENFRVDISSTQLRQQEGGHVPASKTLEH